MKIDGNFSVSRSVVPATGAWRVEKPSTSDNPREDSRRYPTPAVTVSQTSNESTPGCGRRITDSGQPLPQPEFVAQVLGQVLRVMPHNKNAAARAYARSNRGNDSLKFAEVA
jgi:hypothetical protein